MRLMLLDDTFNYTDVHGTRLAFCCAAHIFQWSVVPSPQAQGRGLGPQRLGARTAAPWLFPSLARSSTTPGAASPPRLLRVQSGYASQTPRCNQSRDARTLLEVAKSAAPDGTFFSVAEGEAMYVAPDDSSAHSLKSAKAQSILGRGPWIRQ